MAPFDEKLQPQQRTEHVIELSELVMRIAMHVICYTLVNCQDKLKEERTSIAHAFLQRVTTTHLGNHKLTAEGLVVEYKGQPFELHEEYKTMMLTRSVYEHLVMFFFLFEHPKSDEERDLVWKFWKTNGKTGILSEEDGEREVKPVSYSQAWKYLFHNNEMAQFYRNLSMHCHPVFQGLLQYQDQAVSDQGRDGIPLYFSSCFLAYLCKLFLKQISDSQDILQGEFTKQELSVFYALSRLLKS